MPDDNRFAGIGEQLDEPREEDAEDPGGTASDADAGESPEATTEGGDAGETADSVETGVDDTADSVETGVDDPADSVETGADDTADSGSSAGSDRAEGPAFAFDKTSAKSLYVRGGTLELFEDTEFEVEAALRANHGIRDLTSREFHDALVHVASEHVEEIAAQIDAERADDD
jgi:hypothetical protein